MNKNTNKIKTLALTLALCLALVCFAPAVSADAFQIARPSENRSFQATHRAVEIISCFSPNGKMIIKKQIHSVIPVCCRNGDNFLL